jgi:hypothetical protein
MSGVVMSGLLVARGGGAKIERISVHESGAVELSKGVPRGEITVPSREVLTGIANCEPWVRTGAPGEIPSGSSKRARENAFSSKATI